MPLLDLNPVPDALKMGATDANRLYVGNELVWIKPVVGGYPDYTTDFSQLGPTTGTQLQDADTDWIPAGSTAGTERWAWLDTENAMKMDIPGGNATCGYWYEPVTGTNLRAKFTIANVNTTASNPGVGVRIVPTRVASQRPNGIFAYAVNISTNASIFIAEVNGNTNNVRGAVSGLNLTTPCSITIEAIGNQIYTYLNDSLINTSTASIFLGSGKCGLNYNAGNTSRFAYTNYFECGVI